MRSHQKSETSATLAPTLWVILLSFAVGGLLASAAAPGWWATRDATNASLGTNDYAVALQGQLKQFTARAVDELNADLPTNGGAGVGLSNLVYGWQQDYLTNGYATNTANPTRPYKPTDLQAVNVGQLKYIANLLYDQLDSAGYTGLNPSWLQPNTNTDGTAALVGQVKEVFNFDLSVAPLPATGLAAASNNPNELDLSWTLPSPNTATSITINQSLDGGTTWTLVTMIDYPTATTYTATGLSPGTVAIFEVVLSNSAGNSTPCTSLPSPPVLLPPRYSVIDLGTDFTPVSINDSGVVVGNGPTGPYIWSQGTSTPLSTTTSYGSYLSGITVVGIDDAGHIGGNITSVDSSLWTTFPPYGIPCYWIDTNTTTAPVPMGQELYSGVGSPYWMHLSKVSRQGMMVGGAGAPNWALSFGPDGTSEVLPVSGFGTGYGFAGSCWADAAAGANQWEGYYSSDSISTTNAPVLNAQLYFSVPYTNIGSAQHTAMNTNNVAVTTLDTNVLLISPGSSATLLMTNIGAGIPADINDAVTPVVSGGVTNMVAAPQAIGSDGSGNPTLWDPTTYIGTNTIDGHYVAKNLNQLIPGPDGTNPAPWNIISVTGINDSGIIIGTATSSSDESMALTVKKTLKKTKKGTTSPKVRQQEPPVHAFAAVPVVLEVDGIADKDKVAIGGLVVKNDIASANNPPRQKIKIFAGPAAGNIVLTKADTNNCINVFTASTGTGQIIFSGTGANNVFASSTFVNGELDLYVEGENASTNMQDIKLMVALQSTPTVTDTVSFTVLWVDQPTAIQPIMTFNGGPLLSPNTTTYLAIVNNVNSLGLLSCKSTLPTTTCYGWGTQAQAKVFPTKFKYTYNQTLRLDRSAEAVAWTGTIGNPDPSTVPLAVMPTPPLDPNKGGNDGSYPPFLSSSPDVNNDFIYDLDIPGLIPKAFDRYPAGEIVRLRANFSGFADIKIGNTFVRCSPYYNYYVKFSQIRSPSGSASNWTIINSGDPGYLTGDNAAAYGTTPLTWNP